MRIIDKYILKEIALPILFSLYVLVFLFIIADLFDNLYEIINNHTPLVDVLFYYLNLIPFAFVQTISWATFLGTVYLFTTFSRHGEVTAMKACGLKITDIAAPILFLGLIIGVVTFVVNDRLVPTTFHTALNIKKEKIDFSKGKGKNKVQGIRNATLLSNNRQYFIKQLDAKAKQMKDIRIHLLDDENFVRYKIVAQKGEWIEGHIVLEGVSIYHLDQQGRLIGEPEVSPSKCFPNLSEKPEDFVEASFDTMFLSSKKLANHIERLKNNDLPVMAEYTALHHKRAYPWQSLVIMIITIPFLGRTRNVRHGLAKNVLLCLILVFCYHVISAIFLALGNKGILFPFMSAWLANGSFTMSGVLLFEQANH